MNKPMIIEETSKGIDVYRIEDEMLRNRKLFCVGEITAQSVDILIEALMYLEEKAPGEEIRLYINSPGGSVQSGLALYDVMQGISSPVTTICIGMAASMGALLFISGKKRYMLPHARLMIHDPLIAGGVGGSALSIKATSDDLMKTRDITADILALHSGHTRKEILKLTAKDTYFYAKEACEYSFADEVAENLNRI